MARFHKLLRINLNSRSFRTEDIPIGYERRFLGGKGLGTAYLVQEVPRGTDPLGAGNKLIITAGPLTGTNAPASSRFELVTKSPLTGLYLSCNSGGHFGSELKAAGFDVLIIEEVSASPVILSIRNDRVSFLDASDLWGAHTYETELETRRRVKDPEARVLSIGPAGENRVRFACLSNDFSRNAARGGSGAVLGSKNVKAIALRGTRDIPVADSKEMRKKVSEAREVIFNNPWVDGQRRYGTVRSVEVVNENGFLPVHNFTGGKLPSIQTIDQYAYESRIQKVLSCGECPLACAKGYGRGDCRMEGPEYETVGLFGPNLDILDPDDIAHLNHLCNQYGLDTITAGSLLGALLDTDLFTSETRSRKDTVAGLLSDITERRGVGDLLAEGPMKTGREMGLMDMMPQIKGMGFPAYDPRISHGTSLAYMTADRGACHLCSWPVGRELGGMWSDDDIRGRVEFVKNQQDEKAAEESLTVCQFVYGIGLLDKVLAEMLSISTGEVWDLESMKKAGERCWTLARVFSCREGISRKDDYLPEKFARESIINGPAAGTVIDRKSQDSMLDMYYDFRGWSRDGVPEQPLLRELELEDLIDD